jgi:hypothetical protein
VSGRLTFRVVSGQVKVVARSPVHDTTAVWPGVSGTIRVDPAAPEARCEAEIALDMRNLDAGDALKSWKLKADIQPERHPTATFRLDQLAITGRSGETSSGRASGRLAWRGHEIVVHALGEGRLSDRELEAAARFDLDMRALGIQPPKILFLKVEPVVRVTISLRADRDPRGAGQDRRS